MYAEGNTGHAIASAPARITSVDVVAGETQPPSSHANWQPVALPHRWGADAQPPGPTLWYRMPLRVERSDDFGWAVYVPKASMNADLWVNGRLAARQGSMDGTLTRHWNTPLLFTIPPSLLHAGANELMVRVRASDRHDGGLAPFYVGALEDLEPIADRAHFWRITIVGLMVTFVLALAFVVGIVWARRRVRGDYGYFAVGALGCALSALNMCVASPPMSDPVWEVFMHLSLVVGVLSLTLFVWRFSGAPTRRRRWVCVLIVFADLIALVILDGAALRVAVTLSSLLIFSLAALSLFPLVKHLRQQPTTDFVVFGVAAALSVGIGGYDWLVVSGVASYEAPYALPYIWPILFSSFAWLIAGDYARSQSALIALNAELSERIDAREAALKITYEQLRTVERAHASAEERARILRDMHDGVGGHLATALRQLESGAPSPDDVAHTLRDALDHLKLSIDGMTLPPGDVNALLGAMRYRLTPRLASAGLTVVWNVEELPMWPDAAQEGFMRHLQFLLFELISNVLQHADAKTIEVSACVRDGAIEVVVGDDGHGMREDRVLRSAEARARIVGATLAVETSSRGAHVRIRLRIAPT